MELSLLDRADGKPSEEPVSPAVKIVDVSKRYSGRKYRGSIRSMFVGVPWEVVALDKVSFSIKHGEVFGLLGPNGSGKTTLIKILSNLVIPDSGTIYVEGVNVVKRPYEAATKVQTLLSDFVLGLEKRITVRQNLTLFASLYSLPKSEYDEKIDRLLDYFGISEVADKSSQSLSTGMSRKLQVCRVLLSHASVIVFDEPTAGLDPASADDFRRLIVEDLVKREKKTVFMATHNLAEATSMCDRIALLNHGRLLTIGTPDEIRRGVDDHVNVTIAIGGGDAPLVGLREDIKKVEGISSVDLVETGPVKKMVLTGKRDMSYLNVLSLVQSKGLRMLSLETSYPSLEDAFLRLTREARK